ncbi:hypothetical protein EYF80_030279 [Liparis tanakae]|uniref:Uncharacterized protein n=1 Tax=Liparis tanakae TaxID=230148 RepID=A0A4Z2H3R3_9TELE|nr:hypothetical protein EYF80_030279 [Liparis tanakae]
MSLSRPSAGRQHSSIPVPVPVSTGRLSNRCLGELSAVSFRIQFRCIPHSWGGGRTGGHEPQQQCLTLRSTRQEAAEPETLSGRKGGEQHGGTASTKATDPNRRDAAASSQMDEEEFRADGVDGADGAAEKTNTGTLN